MKAITIIIVSFLTTTLYGQAPEIAWEKELGGTFDESGRKVLSTSDGGYIAIATTSSVDSDVTENAGLTDFWVIKTDASGDIIWQETYGGSNQESVADITPAYGGGYIVVGSSNSTDGDITENKGLYDVWAIRIDDYRNLIWQKTYGGSLDDRCYSVLPTSNGYILAGHSNSSNGDITNHWGAYDFWVLEIDFLGNIIWQKKYGGNDNESALDISYFTDGYIVTGYSMSANGNVSSNQGGTDYWIIAIDNTGNLLWQKSMGGSDYDYAVKSLTTDDGGFLVVGETLSNDGDITFNNGNYDIWIVKLTSQAEVEWQQSFGGSNAERVRNIIPDANGGYLILSETSSNNGDITESFGGSDMWLLKIDNDGYKEWQKSIGTSYTDGGYGLSQTPDAGYILAGYKYFEDTTSDVWLVKLGGSSMEVQQFDKSRNIMVYPNPSSDLVFIQSEEKISNISVKNMAGQTVQIIHQKNIQSVDISGLVEGMYILEMKDHKGDHSFQKLIKK